MRRLRATGRLGLLLLACGLVAVTASAQQFGPPQVRVILRPPMARLGERVTYRVEVIGAFYQKVSWLAPDSSTAFTWGEPRQGFTKGRLRQGVRFGTGARAGQIREGTADTAWVEIPLQVFELGVISVPGIGLRYVPNDGGSQRVVAGRAPIARLVVIPVLTSADSNATLRPLHGPLAAPWWEQVPWLWVIAGLLLLALVILALRWRRRRKPGKHVAPVRAPLSPAAEAMAALGELRRLDLPRQDRFAEHAFRLGQILRRFLEATVATTHPGDTTPELVRHLAEAGLSDEDQKRLAGLLRVWDRVKFAREPFTYDEAMRAETAVEAHVRRAAGHATEEAA
jgi:hypothetical protein